ncbi:MAG: hypothetical protein GY788_21705, partial [bacterium]|nr:hypothetical protein [bacterium]
IAVADGDRAKDSQLTLTRLADFFRQLDDDEKGLVAEALCGWISLSDERRRFAAYVLIDDFGLSMAEPAMRDRRAVLARSEEPSASFEEAKVQRILDRLDGSDQSGVS